MSRLSRAKARIYRVDERQHTVFPDGHLNIVAPSKWPVVNCSLGEEFGSVMAVTSSPQGFTLRVSWLSGLPFRSPGYGRG